MSGYNRHLMHEIDCTNPLGGLCGQILRISLNNILFEKAYLSLSHSHTVQSHYLALGLFLCLLSVPYFLPLMPSLYSLSLCLLHPVPSLSGGWCVEAADAAAAAADSGAAHAGLHPDFSCQGAAPGLQCSSGQPPAGLGYLQHLPGERAASHPQPPPVSAPVDTQKLIAHSQNREPEW